ncbi:hypothetical protein PIB30_105670 [Stylosanthes scabra]|uniref:Putative plant transposon protein domain-containing protein n=1 Tax=Stylosanthes scabra TaxID=79078 RepID=A0ABU6UZY6_9FABA|nr:hypothetical protein [Stylosanthes scabra]
MASSSVSVFDNYSFKTSFNEELYNTIVKNKKVIVECYFDLDDDEYPEVREQIALRGWRRLAAPKPEISIDLIHEFYANAIITEEEMEEHGGHTYRSFVRGVPINFSPENIRNLNLSLMASSSVSVFDNYGFKTSFNEELYNTIVKNKKVIVECYFDLDDDEYPEVREQIALRGWRRLAAPKPEISIDLIHEFYANSIITEEEMEEHGGHTYRSFVRGVPINFSPENIRNVMRFKAQVEGATTDFETRKEHDQQLDRVLADLCMPGATGKLSTGQQRVPIQLRR